MAVNFEKPHALCLGLIPLKPASKIPDLPTWAEYQTRLCPRAEFDSWFGIGVRRNAGIVLGPVCGVVVIESDNLDAVSAAM